MPRPHRRGSLLAWAGRFHPQRLGLGRASILDLLHGLGWNTAAVIITRGQGVLLVVVLARLLGVDGYGIWMQVNVVASLFSMVAGLGLYQSVVQFYPEAEDRQGRRVAVWNALVPVLLMGTLLAGAAGFTGPWLSSTLVHTESQGWTFRLSGALGALFAVRLVLLNYLRAQDRPKLFSAASAAAETVTFVATLLLAWIYRSVEAAVLGSVLATAVVVAWLVGTLTKDLGAPVLPDRALWRQLRYALPLVPTMLGDEALARADRLLLGGMLGPTATGVYSAVYAMVSLPQALNTAFINVLFPKMTGRRWSKSQTKGIWSGSIGIYTLLSIAFIAVLSVCGKPALKLLLGAKLTVMPQELPLLILVTGAGVTLFCIGRLISLEIYVRKRTGLIAAIWCGASAVNLSLNVLLIPRMGLLGAGLATAVAYLLFVCWMALAVRLTRQTETPNLPANPV